MADARGPAAPRALAVGALLVVLGVLCWLLYAVQAGTEQHSYAAGGPPPNYVRVVSGHTYWIAIPGGVRAESGAGLDPAKLQCTATSPGEAPGPLDVAAETGDSKAIDQIGSFVAQVSARVHVDCTGIGSVYVDNAADAGTDWSGVWLVLASILLAIGLPVTLAALRRGPAVERV